jgi:hypothetical protein
MRISNRGNFSASAGAVKTTFLNVVENENFSNSNKELTCVVAAAWNLDTFQFFYKKRFFVKHRMMCNTSREGIFKSLLSR